MKRNIIWSLILHAVVIIGGSQIAPMGGFATTSPNTFDVINVGIIDSPSGAQKPPAKIPELKPPPPAIDAAIAEKPTADLTKEDVEPVKKPEPEKPKPKPKEDKPKTAERPADTAASQQLAQAGEAGATGKISEGAGGEDVWGVESIANVNPYHSRGFASVRNNWRNPAVGPRPLKCIIRFKVERSGTIKDIALEQSSGSPLFDRAALRAIKVTEAWEQFPKFWEENEQIIHLEFEYRP